MPKFCLFSKEKGYTKTPDALNPKPATYIPFYQDPLFGDYNPAAGGQGRGTVIPTFSGAVIQDFGIVEADGRILISDKEAFDTETATKLRLAFRQVNTTFYFTDGYEVWEVAFARPDGYKDNLHLLFAAADFKTYSYTMQLVVVQKLIGSATTTTTTTTSTTTTTTTSTTAP